MNFDPDDLFSNDDGLVGRDHPSTSWYAARSIYKLNRKRVAVLRYLVHHPDGATDEEMQTWLRMNANTQRPRRVELVRCGYVANSGRTRPTDAAKPAIVWVATHDGIDALRKHDARGV